MPATVSGTPNNFAQWFHDERVRIFPIKARSKEPLCRSWDDYTCTREEAGRFINYGVCGSSTVIGIVDSDTPQSEAWVAEHCPDTPFKVRTVRGVHRYYRLMYPTPKFIHRSGLTIEFRNQGQYVVGPGSTHPSGAIYQPDDWSWNFLDIPIFPTKDFCFDDRVAAPREPGAGFDMPDKVYAGERHDVLFKLLRQYKAWGNTFEATRDMVLLANTQCCEPPVTVDRSFERWMRRAWANPDRLLPGRIPLDIDLTKKVWL